MKTAEAKRKSAVIPAGSASDDLEQYISRRKKRDPRLARTFEEGYQVFLIGARLQAEREKAGVTQSELARRIGTTKTAISRLENGRRDIRLSTVERIAHALGRVVSIELKAA